MLIGIQRCKERAQKSPVIPGFFSYYQKRELLNFRFFVHDVLAYDWIEFLHFQFSRHGALVFGRCVEMSGAR